MTSIVDSASQDTAFKADLLEESFERMQPHSNEFIVSFFESLFVDYPATKSLFVNMNVAQRDNKLLSSLMFVVENAKKEGALASALEGLGAYREGSSALQEHYSSIGNTLSKTFEQYLGGHWTLAVQQAWVETYGIITEVMLEKANDSAAAASTPEVDDATGLKIAILEESFEKVKPHANEFVASFYENLFTDYPAAKPLFVHTDMGDQGRKLLTSLVFVIENLRRPGALTDALKGLGARHVKYGALPEHYPLVGNSLLKTFEQYLQTDWTPDVKQAWVDAYGLITEVMLEGADYSPEAVELESPAPEAVEVPESNIKSGTAAGLIGGGLVVLVIMFLLI